MTPTTTMRGVVTKPSSTGMRVRAMRDDRGVHHSRRVLIQQQQQLTGRKRFCVSSAIGTGSSTPEREREDDEEKGNDVAPPVSAAKPEEGGFLSSLGSRTTRWASEQAEDERVHRGLYCDWKMTGADVLEVWAYRAGLVVLAGAAVECAVRCVSGDYADAQTWYFIGGAGLGCSLYLVHMYVGFIKRVMQTLYAVGMVGSGVLAVTHAEPLPLYVAEHPLSILAVGPAFAALTGLAFKEGMCYGKFEAAALFFAAPTMCLTHLFGASEETQTVAVGVFVSLLVVFAGRKFSQELKDDVGDKSIFMFDALDEAEQARWLANARASGRDL